MGAVLAGDTERPGTAATAWWSAVPWLNRGSSATALDEPGGARVDSPCSSGQRDSGDRLGHCEAADLHHLLLLRWIADPGCQLAVDGDAERVIPRRAWARSAAMRACPSIQTRCLRSSASCCCLVRLSLLMPLHPSLRGRMGREVFVTAPMVKLTDHCIARSQLPQVFDQGAG